MSGIDGHLAQLVRAFGLHPKGREFESLSAHYTTPRQQVGGVFLFVVSR